MRKDKLIGVKLDFKDAASLGYLMLSFEESVSSGLERAAELDPTFTYAHIRKMYLRITGQ